MTNADTKAGGRDSVIKKPTTASPTTQPAEEQSAIPSASNEANNLGIIQAVTVVSPQNVKRVPKPKTVDSSNVNVVNVKKSAVVVKGKQPGGPNAPVQVNAPLTL